MPVQGCNAELSEVGSASLTSGGRSVFEAFGDLRRCLWNLVKTLAPHKVILTDLLASGELLSIPLGFGRGFKEAA